MRQKCTSQDRPAMLRRKKTPAPWMAWYYSEADTRFWRTEFPFALDLDPERRSWLEVDRKPVPQRSRQKPDPSPQR